MEPVSTIHRIEGAAIAAAAVNLFIVSGFSWWWLLALFLVFDLSFIGYAVSNRAGALSYNLVHTYAAPAVLLAVYGILLAVGSRCARGHSSPDAGSSTSAPTELWASARDQRVREGQQCRSRCTPV